jgi:subtilisin family serine protease
MTMLSTAAMTALAAMSFNISTVVAAPATNEAKAAARSKFTNNAYIVQLAEQPVTAYTGGIKGLQATKPRKGQKIDPNSAAVVNYLSFLQSRQEAILASVGGGKKLHSYGYVFNGFAAELTAEQAAKLAATPGVLNVTKDYARELETSSTPDFLGLSGSAGVWNSLGVTGENVIIGIIDGGAWPEHPSFSDRTGVNGNATQDGKLGYQQIPGWNGRCVPGEAFTASNCNQKLIGARYYNAGWGGNAGIDAQLPWEYNSPRDFGGHGTHTATTAGGNANVPATGPASVFGSISGIAPRARIAAYKVCWETGTGGSCFNSDSVAAIDQAVADGVDVLNFSISGSATSFRDAVEVAFLFAADAGVFVAASAGNSGPASSTVAHASPWLTTVAAGTHNRDGAGSVTLGNGATYSGASVATAVGPAPFIDSTAAGLPGADPTAVALCFAAEDNGGVAALDPAKVAGKIVLCDRGVTARINKSLAVQEAGGVGMVLVNTSANSINADLHFVPTVHLQNTDRAAVKAYAATAGATATINAATIIYSAAAPFTAAFSSRGPSRAANGDILKPDLIAPGQDVLAGVAPPGNSGRLFDIYSGTSMSSPHVAGLAALFKQKYPGWSPMAIKSALMTTGYDVLDGGTPAPNTNPVLIFRQGAGHVAPAKAFNPGLVYNSSFDDWLSFLCGAQPGGGCTGVTPMDPSDLNQASIAIGDLAGLQTVKRKVTNVSGGPLTVSAGVTGMLGFTTTVTPSTLTLAPGQTREFTVSFVQTSAAPNAYTGGQLTWTGGGYSVRSPIVVRPVALAAPAAVASNGTAVSYPVTFGYNGAFTATPRGLVAAAITAGSVADDPTDSACSLTSPNAVLLPVAVPAGTTYARFSLFDADVNAGTDIDLCVFNGTTLAGSSGSGTSAEEVNLLNPAAGNYMVVVQGWGVVGTSPFKLHTWLLDSTDAGNMAVAAPATAVLGTTGTIGLSFSGLTVGTKYLGSVAYGGVAGLPNPTIVRVDP